MLYATGYNNDHWSYMEPVVLYINDVLIQDTNGRPKVIGKKITWKITIGELNDG